MLRLVLGLEPDFEIVGEARDGVAAIEVAREVRPDVLLLDITMPNMSGIEALPSIIEASPNTRVIMLTGVTNASVRARSLAGGAFRYLEKGLNPDEIASAVRAAHDGHAA